jgi:alkyldihydroxyacetonephosphate synthase
MAVDRMLETMGKTGVAALAQTRKWVDALRPHEAATPRGGETRFTPEPLGIAADERESNDMWGFADTAFEAKPNGDVYLTGSRYELSNQRLPTLLPWVQSVMGVTIDPLDTRSWPEPTAFPKPRANTAFFNDIKSFLSENQWSQDGAARLRHGHGHTQEEMYAIKFAELGRIPDLVVWPTDEEQVVRLVSAAKAHNVVLIPYGGGTNVTDALRCPENEKRVIVSVDMRKMNQILWIDPVNRMAFVQAGAVGRHIIANLARYGWTMGHEPDSVEFSTMGGWIATNASGMKKNRYGNIEDIVLDVHVVTAAGKLERTSVGPRESVGIDPRQWLFGSEGTLGIITGAVVKLFPLPEVQNYGSILFPTFEDGVAFMYELAHAGNWPASVRLMDNLQFQFGQALKPASEGWKVQKSKIEKVFVTQIKGFDPTQMVACTLVFEGSRADVAAQEARVYGIASKHAGMKAGAENGSRGYQLTYSIAYIRDFVMKHWVLAESFETSVPWSQVLPLCAAVKARIYAEHAKRKLPGTPFITCRVTQIYDTGVCVYFYFAFHYKGVENPTAVYHELENAARDEILAQGGSLSHHHGVGKLRQDYLPRIMSEAGLAWRAQAKKALDPTDIFGSHNQEPAKADAVGGAA